MFRELVLFPLPDVREEEFVLSWLLKVLKEIHSKPSL
jgi:hypothetical protein